MRRLLCLLLLCLPLLAACGKTGEVPPAAPPPLYEALDLTPDEILLTVDGRAVPAWRYLYWLAYDCGQLADAYAEAGLDLDWDAPAEGGVSLADYARRQALADTALYATVENWAETYGVLPPEDIPDTDASLLDCPAALGLGEPERLELLADAHLYHGLLDLFSTEGSTLAPDPAALDEYARAQGYLTLAWVRLPAEADREAGRQQAAELFSQLNASGTPAAAFSALAEPYGCESATFLPGTGVLPDSVEAAAKTLAEDQCSGILEAEDGFYLLLRRPLDAASALNDYFDTLLLSAAASAEVRTEAACERLDVPGFYSALENSSSGTES